MKYRASFIAIAVLVCTVAILGVTGQPVAADGSPCCCIAASQQPPAPPAAQCPATCSSTSPNCDNSNVCGAVDPARCWTAPTGNCLLMDQPIKAHNWRCMPTRDVGGCPPQDHPTWRWRCWYVMQSTECGPFFNTKVCAPASAICDPEPPPTELCNPPPMGG